ncbi:MAG: hypothetical protein ABIG69_11105 [Bacteroidota bacterium]
MLPFELILVVVLLALCIAVFVMTGILLRRRGGSLTSTIFGATYDFYFEDKRKAIKMIVEKKADKKLEEIANEKDK